MGVWRAKISSLRYNTKLLDGIKRVEGSAGAALWKH